MDRRRYLALVGSGLTLSIAGCTGDDDNNGGENGGDDSSSGSEGGSENGNDTEDEEKGEDDSGTDLEEIAFGQTLDLTLESGDGEDPAYNDLAKPVLFEASADDEVTITQSSDAFDTFLVLEGPNGSVVAENDDGDGISLNSRISTTLTESGEYTIWPGSFSGDSTGPFTLSLEEGLYSGSNTGSDNANNEDSTEYAGLVIEETEFVSDSNRFIAGNIVGTVLNDTGEETYAQAEATLYSEDGSVVGNPILDNISGLDQGQRWEFEITVYESDWARYEVEVTTGF
jgi:hypothetical protein